MFRGFVLRRALGGGFRFDIGLIVNGISRGLLARIDYNEGSELFSLPRIYRLACNHSYLLFVDRFVVFNLNLKALVLKHFLSILNLKADNVGHLIYSVAYIKNDRAVFGFGSRLNRLQQNCVFLFLACDGDRADSEAGFACLFLCLRELHSDKIGNRYFYRNT